MAKATTKQTETIYILELTKREANALSELLLAVDSARGEGSILDDVYMSLVGAGAASESYFHNVREDRVVVSRVEAGQ
jgi:hypothetical protein